LPKCKYDYKPKIWESIPPEIPLDCKEEHTKNSEFCIFHDKNYFEGHEQEAAKRFEEKVKEDSINQNEPLVCFGYYLPYINFASLLKRKRFAQPVYFNEATFSKKANFSEATFAERADFGFATFSKEVTFVGATFKEANFIHTTFTESADFEHATFTERANFAGAKFSKEAYFERVTFSRGANFSQTKFLAEVYFLETKFNGNTVFKYANFEQPNKVTFDDRKLSNVSFADSDVTRIRFGDGIKWGGDDEFTIVEEEWLKRKAQKKNDVKDGGVVQEEKGEDVSLELVLSVYRNLRENYEFRLRYDDAGKFFIKEMELKRNYREIRTEYGTEPRKNRWVRRNFSLTGLYYHFSRYGESISRPTLIGAITVFLSTLFWVTQSNPSLEPHIPFFFSDNSTSTAASINSTTSSTFVGFDKAGEPSQWREAFERSFADFLPLLPAGNFEVGIIDFIIKIVGGALTFGLLLIAFRRKFERKYTR
jgi:hypothetical protein